jgi:MoxR-like ATPase
VPPIEPAPQVPPTIDTDLEQRLKKAGILAARGVVRHPPTEPSPEVPPIEPSKQPAIEQDLKPPSIEMDEANNTEQWLLDDPRHQDVGRINHTLQLIKDQIHRVVVGKDDLIEDLYLCLLAEGNVLLEGYPGIAKTRVAKLFAQTLGCKFNRQQFTPDLLPADITGTYVFDRKTSEFYVRKGGIFSNIVMVDEINRATPRAQSALLESMEERAVTIEGTTFPLELPFMVIATEAPAGFEGTYPLPEVQLDRFTAKLKMDYPDADEELEIIDIKDRVEENTESVTDRSDLLQMIAIARQIYVGAAVKRYIRNIVMSTRQRNDLVLAASPRASIGLLRLSKALAAVRGRSFVIPDDVKAVAPIVLPHRLVVAPRFDLEGVTPETITEEILNTVEADDLSVLVPPR